jgi:hypothetical protein
MYAHGPGAIAESTVMSCAVCAHGAGATVEYRMNHIKRHIVLYIAV